MASDFMHLVLCHTTADFDTLGAAVGAALLRPGSRIVLTGGAHPTVQSFLAIWRDEYPLIDRKAVDFDHVRSLTLVDASSPDRFSPVSDWFTQAKQLNLPIYVYDHHDLDNSSESSDQLAELPSAEAHLEAVGAATTLITEALRLQSIPINSSEATVMALGIHSDTGSLGFEQATVRDAEALAWLMRQGANQQVIADNREPGLSPKLQSLLSEALDAIQTEHVRGHYLGWVQLKTAHFVPGLSGLTEHLIAMLNLDTLLLSAMYVKETQQAQKQTYKAVVIGRSHANPLLPQSSIDLSPIFEALGGGGHAQAASAVLDTDEAAINDLFESALKAVRDQVPQPPSARLIMSSPVRTVLPKTSIDEAQRILLRYGHTGLCVVDESGKLLGLISRRDIDVSLRHGLGHAPVTGCMSRQIKSIEPQTFVTDIQDLMTTYDIGRLPVLDQGRLVGIVTRTDLLRQLHQAHQDHNSVEGPRPEVTVKSSRDLEDAPATSIYRPSSLSRPPSAQTLFQQLEARLSEIWPALMLIADIADQKGWAIYLVGGGVRDLLLDLVPDSARESHPLTDIDLVVDGAGEGAGVALAEAIQQRYSQVELQVHGKFQTAALIWHSVGSDDPLLLDIATARTEFYPYPAANPEVEASTIRQDLYRRDFALNAMAIRLNCGSGDGAQQGQLLDFFGGWLDLQQRQIRVLHSNSFIEDPTRIFRAVRFAVRLGFSIDSQTETFIRYAISSGVYEQTQANEAKAPALQTRLKAELRYLLSADHWEASLTKISRLGALACLHSSLEMTPAIWRQLRRMTRWLNKFDVNSDDSYLAAVAPQWLMLLELIIAQLEPSARALTAANLHLDTQSQQRLKHLHLWEADLLKQLPNAEKPSEIYRLLKKYGQSELLLMSDRHPYTLGPQIWQYIVQLSHQPPLLNGDVLKQLGYKPGPQFRDILTTVHHLTLNGELTTAQATQSYVLAHFPSQ